MSELFAAPPVRIKESGKPLVFLDMDGVIADFHRSACIAHNRPWSNHDDLPTDWGITDAEFWDVLNHTPLFWETLDKTLLADWLIDFLFGRSELYILSNPGKLSTQSAWNGKMAWMARHFPNIPQTRILLVKDKYLLSQTNRLLIDDLDKNLQWWRSQGGDTIWWNRNHTPQGMQSVFQSQYNAWLKFL